jgi:hypothetical protein
MDSDEPSSRPSYYPYSCQNDYYYYFQGSGRPVDSTEDSVGDDVSAENLSPFSCECSWSLRFVLYGMIAWGVGVSGRNLVVCRGTTSMMPAAGRSIRVSVSRETCTWVPKALEVIHGELRHCSLGVTSDAGCS